MSSTGAADRRNVKSRSLGSQVAVDDTTVDTAPKIPPWEARKARKPSALQLGRSPREWASVRPGVLRRAGLWRQAHLVTEAAQALDQIVPQPLRLPLVKVVHPQIPVLDII